MTRTKIEIPDQRGRLAIVTGANSGLGLITAQELACARASVVLACRDRTRAARAAGKITDAIPDAAVAVEELDLASLSSVRRFAARVASRHDGVDLLVNNAGVMALPRRLSADGFELHLATNHLGHFALTGLLIDALRARPAPRVVTVTSFAHRMWRIAFRNLDGGRGYWRWAAYAQSKLANLLFAYELQRRADEAGLELRSIAAHPGYAVTNLQTSAVRTAPGPITLVEAALMQLTNLALAQSAEKGAHPILYAATAHDLAGGSFVGPGGPFGLRGRPKCVSSSRRARNQETARRLWQVSEELTGVRWLLAPS